MSQKAKGTNAERQLIHKFWAQRWAAIRTAGSGSQKYPSPDILAGNNLRKLAIECKVTKDKSKYLPKNEIHALKEFSGLFGAEPWIAVKFNNKDWYFMSIEDLKETENSYLASEQIAKNKGLLFEEVIK